jgi:hypothetical protein
MPKRSLIKITLFVSVDDMEKLQGSAAFKKTIFALSFRENNKAINTDSYLEN